MGVDDQGLTDSRETGARLQASNADREGDRYPRAAPWCVRYICTMHGYPLFRRVRDIPDLGRVIAAIKVTPIPPVGPHPRVSFGVFDWALPVGNLRRGSIVVRGVTVSFTERASEIRHYYCGLPFLL